MVDREDELQIVEAEMLDQKLSENQKFVLYQALQNYPCLWDSLYSAFKSKQDFKQQKEKALEVLSQKFNLTQSYLKRQLHTLRTLLLHEIKKENEGHVSKWKFYETVKYIKEDVLCSLKSKEENEWSGNETEQLIEYFKENDQLWNHHLTSYRDRNSKELNFTKLYELLPGRSHEEIAKQWNILKTIFNREVKKEEESKVSGAGTDIVYTSQWKYLKSMMFIKGCDDVDPAVSTTDDVHARENLNPAKKMKAEKIEKAKEMAEVKLNLYKEATKCLQTPLPLAAAEPNVERDDSISTFVKSLECSLRQFSGHHLAIAKKRINDVIFELEMECYGQQSAPVSARCQDSST